MTVVVVHSDACLYSGSKYVVTSFIYHVFILHSMLKTIANVSCDCDTNSDASQQTIIINFIHVCEISNKIYYSYEVCKDCFGME